MSVSLFRHKKKLNRLFLHFMSNNTIKARVLRKTDLVTFDDIFKEW